MFKVRVIICALRPVLGESLILDHDAVYGAGSC